MTAGALDDAIDRAVDKRLRPLVAWAGLGLLVGGLIGLVF